MHCASMQIDLQAQARAHRIGQKNKVVHRLWSSGQMWLLAP